MNNTPDMITAADRLLTLERTRTKLLLLDLNLAEKTSAEVQDQIVELNQMREDVDRFVQMGDIEAFAVSKSINDILELIREWQMLNKLKPTKRKIVYAKANSTLRFIAEDELGDQAEWIRVASRNRLNYSTDLLNLKIIDIP